MRRYRLWLLTFLFFPLITHAASTPYTIPETYDKIRELAALTLILQRENNLAPQLPHIEVVGAKGLPHEYQKGLEVLTKINRYRQIKQLGPVAVPPYPSREITASEVYELLQRLINEIKVLLPNPPDEVELRARALQIPEPRTFTHKSSYQLLWQISKAFDPLLSVRGFTPSDVYGQTLVVLDTIRFLRQTQNLNQMPPKPKRPNNKHPNHALAEALTLQRKINQAEHNLWMETTEVPEVPKRIITPTEVYDQMQTLIAELQRIKYRLGVERDLLTPPPIKGKTPSDVVQNLRWAQAAMPLFPLDKPLYQYDPKFLLKEPSDVYGVADLVLRKLRAYKRFRGIRVKARKVPYVEGLRPRHVFQKTIEALDKTMKLREQAGLGTSALPLYPMREITPSDVYQQAVRLDRELNLIYKTAGMDISRFTPRIFENKVPSDVFKVMWTISFEMDTLLGSQGQTPSHVFQMASYLEKHARQLATHIGMVPDTALPPFKPGLKPKDVIVKAREVFKLIQDMKQRAGLFSLAPPIPPHSMPVTPTDVYNLVGVILPELIELEVHLGIHHLVDYPPFVAGKTPSHVYQKLEQVRRILHAIRFGENAHAP